MGSITKSCSRIHEYAVVVHPDDAVAVVKKPVSAGLCVQLADGAVVEVMADITPGHRFAIRDIPLGTDVLQYGQPIGTSLGIRPGESVTQSHMDDKVPV